MTAPTVSKSCIPALMTSHALFLPWVGGDPAPDPDPGTGAGAGPAGARDTIEPLRLPGYEVVLPSTKVMVEAREPLLASHPADWLEYGDAEVPAGAGRERERFCSYVDVNIGNRSIWPNNTPRMKLIREMKAAMSNGWKEVDVAWGI
jgi:hypothetical protein